MTRERDPSRRAGDADVVDALYSERGPSEASADDVELAQLRSLRGMFAELKAQQEEPPTAGMSLLMAAARQAAEARRPVGLWARLRAGWLAMAAHPAMSAAAAAVVVIGAAGYLMSQGMGRTVESTVSHDPAPAAAEHSKAAPSPEPGTGLVAPEVSTIAPVVPAAEPAVEVPTLEAQEPAPAAASASTSSAGQAVAPRAGAGAGRGRDPGEQAAAKVGANKGELGRADGAASPATRREAAAPDEGDQASPSSAASGAFDTEAAHYAKPVPVEIATDGARAPSPPPPAMAKPKAIGKDDRGTDVSNDEPSPESASASRGPVAAPAAPAKRPAPPADKVQQAEPPPAKNTAAPGGGAASKAEEAPATGTITRPAERWYALAKDAAAKGNCAAVKVLAQRVKSEDPSFYDSRFRKDPALQKCL